MGFILFVHIIVCILLVVTILLQAGKGGGLADSFSSAESMFGTQTNQFMVRFSSVLAAIFLATSLTLAVKSSKKDKSLMDDSKLLNKAVATAPAKKTDEAPTVTVEEPKPMAAPIDAKAVTTNTAK
jgi:preprotein translocase subunit SecG